LFAWAGNPPTTITLQDVDACIDHGWRLGNTIATANGLDYFYEDGVQTDLTWEANPLRCAARTWPPLLSVGDWRGNLLMRGTSVYTWDAANRLVGASVNGVASSFEYSRLPAPVAHRPGTGQAPWPAWRSHLCRADRCRQDGQVGNRTAHTMDGVTTEYVLDAGGGLPEVIVATTGGARVLEPLSPLSGAECAEGRSGQRHQRISATSAILWQEAGRGGTSCRTPWVPCAK
jgi:hypothetical protein